MRRHHDADRSIDERGLRQAREVAVGDGPFAQTAAPRILAGASSISLAERSIRYATAENPPELQRTGWQAILGNFGRHVEAKGSQPAR